MPISLSLTAFLSPLSLPFSAMPMMDVWAVVARWVTPTPLFILLNIVIGVITVTCPFDASKKQRPQEHQQHKQPSELGESPGRLARRPSLFSRFTSFNLSSHLNPTNYCNYYDSNNHRSEPSDYHDEPPLSSCNTVGGESSNPPPVDVHPLQSQPKLAPAPTPIARAPSFLSRVASFNFSFKRSAQIEDPAAVEVEDEAASDEYVVRTESEPTRRKQKVDADEMLRKSASDMAGEKKKPPAGTKGNKETAWFGGGWCDEEVDAKADDFINRFKQQLRLQRLDSILRYRNTAK